jgi:hypothetical protein
VLKATVVREYQGIVKERGTRQTTEPGVKLEFEDWEGGRRKDEDAGRGSSLPANKLRWYDVEGRSKVGLRRSR